jgi:hypothetical protein
MIGSRLRIVFLGGFFTFAFAMLFLALMQDYVRAETPQLTSFSSVSIDVADIAPIVDHEIIPSF